MIKSLKGQLILSIFVSLCFIYYLLSDLDLKNEGSLRVANIMFYIAMLTSIFNAGILTQKFIDSKKDT